MKTLLFILLSSLTLSGQFRLLHKSTFEEEDVIRLNVVAGQSNAVGGTGTDWSGFTTPASVSDVRLQLSTISNGNAQGTSFPSLQLQPRTNQTFAGPEMGFSIDLTSNFGDRNYAIFKSALGGTSIFTHWDHNPPAPLDLTRITVADLATYKTNLAASTGKIVILESVFWWQGESDADNNNAFIWEAKMVETIDFWRTTLGEPNLKFYLGRLPDYQSAIYVNHQVLRDAVENIANNDVNVEFIDLDGLNSDDGVHIDQPSQLIAGQRWFTQYQADFP